MKHKLPLNPWFSIGFLVQIICLYFSVEGKKCFLVIPLWGNREGLMMYCTTKNPLISQSCKLIGITLSNGGILALRQEAAYFAI